MHHSLITAARGGFTVLSPATGQATLWFATAAEARRWAHRLADDTHNRPPDQPEAHRPHTSGSTAPDEAAPPAQPDQPHPDQRFSPPERAREPATGGTAAHIHES
jgi:hypothetical protein